MKKVIIIEDSPTFCNMLGNKLEAKGWETILCYNYGDGLKAVNESSEWDVVISSILPFTSIILTPLFGGVYDRVDGRILILA